MKILMIVSFWLSSTIVFQGCSVKRHHERNVDREKLNVLVSANNSLLFKVGIRFYKRHFSCLAFVKNLPDDTGKHIVYMTEFGLTLLELKYMNDTISIVSMKENFANKHMINEFTGNMRLMLQDFKYIEKYTVKTRNNEIQAIKFAHLNRRYTYRYKNSNQRIKIIIKNGWLPSTKVRVIQHQSNQTSVIYFKKCFIKQSTQYEQLKLKE